ncbi:MAG TPA: hypothetical protein VJC39_04285 [Candidatus Nanoarchaeia archaeon]|nr:hypothetical protein [Candidatus Nanoarchaeia archaeon]
MIPINYIVGHRADPDGIMCHAIFRRNEKNTRHIYADYGDVNGHLRSLVNLSPGTVQVADLSYHHSIEPILAELNSKGHVLNWYDHHNDSRDNEDLLKEYCWKVRLGQGLCAAKLVSREYPEDDYGSFLSEIGQVHDFHNQTDIVMYSLGVGIMDIMSKITLSGINLEDLVVDLAEEKVFESIRTSPRFNPQYKKIVQEFQICKQKAIREMDQSLEYVEMDGYVVATAFSDRILYMKPGLDHLQDQLIKNKNPVEEKVDCCIVFYAQRPNVVMVTGGKIGSSIIQFSKSQGGGGRDHGGGFQLDHDNSPQTYSQDRLEILERLREYLSTLKK